MLARFRPRLTFANVVSLVALFVALGGSAYAVSSLPKNSVGSRQLKKNSVTGRKVKNGSLSGADINESSLRDVPVGVAIRQKVLTLANNSVAGAGAGADDGTVRCAVGEHAIGGGVRIDNGEQDQYIVSSRPTVGDQGVPANGGTANGWRGVVGDSGAFPDGSRAEVFAVCAK